MKKRRDKDVLAIKRMCSMSVKISRGLFMEVKSIKIKGSKIRRISVRLWEQACL